MDAMRQLGIDLGSEEAECFARGLMLPDLPDADFRGIASGAGEIPVAQLLAMKMEVTKILGELGTQIDSAKKRLQEKYWFLDIDDPRQWPVIRRAAEPIARVGGRVKYWWDDSSFVGPILSRMPGARRTETIRSHYGDLAYYHGMGDSGASAEALQGNIAATLNSWIERFRDLRGSDCCRAYIMLGMALHVLTDTWTPGHTQRGPDGSITLFQDYNRQSLHFHEYYDNLAVSAPGAYDSAVGQSASMIQMATGGGPLDAAVFFPLAPNAGVGVIPGTEKATFWNTLLNGPSGRN